MLRSSSDQKANGSNLAFLWSRCDCLWVVIMLQKSLCNKQRNFVLLVLEGIFVVLVGQGPDGNWHFKSPLNHFLVLFCIRILWSFPSVTSFLDNCRCFYNSFVLCYWLSGLVYGKHWSGYNLENLQISRWVIICTHYSIVHITVSVRRRLWWRCKL